MRRKDEQGLFAGVREVVDQVLDVDDYATRRAALLLSKRGLGQGSGALVQRLFKVLDQDWIVALSNAQPSRQNFRWRCPQTYIANDNASAEVSLERALICALRDADRHDWSNQVPLISGIAGSHAFKRRAIDLVQRRGERSFEFVELKIESDTPVLAAIEILAYGLLWLLSHRDRQRLGYAGPIPDAQDVGLSVLAPQEYYRRYSVGGVATTINDGLLALGQQQGVTMEFRFTAFPPSFSWATRPGGPPRPHGADLIALLDHREAVADCREPV
jgi:hypothetical protein